MENNTNLESMEATAPVVDAPKVEKSSKKPTQSDATKLRAARKELKEAEERIQELEAKLDLEQARSQMYFRESTNMKRELDDIRNQAIVVADTLSLAMKNMGNVFNAIERNKRTATSEMKGVPAHD